MIELDQLLNDNCTAQQISDYFQNGEFFEEHYLISAIKKHLVTGEQQTLLLQEDISIEDMLNGRVEGRESLINSIYATWNEQLGHEHFCE